MQKAWRSTVVKLLLGILSDVSNVSDVSDVSDVSVKLKKIDFLVRLTSYQTK